jgi:TolB protein
MRSFCAAVATAGTVLALLPVGPEAVATPPGPDGDVVFAATHSAPIHGVYVVNPANATPTIDRVEEGNYTDSAAGGIGPVFSRGGLLAMSLQNDAGKARIQIGTRTYKTDDTTLTTVATNHLGDYDPAWRPDGGLVAFTGVVKSTGGVSRIAYGHRGDIWTMKTDGSDKQQLTTTGGNGSPNQDPTWNPDGTALAFDTFTGGGQHLAMVNADGSGYHVLTPNLDGSSPVWSPDGTKLAFDSFAGDSSSINVLTLASGHVDQITSPGNAKLDLYPSWSPNGNKLVFERFDEQSGNATIYFVPAAGGSLSQLTSGHHPAWSPDGSTIVYTKASAADGTNFDIYSVPVSGGSPDRLTNNDADDYEPTWSYNGNKILFSSARNSDADVFVMDADGANETKLTSNVGHYTNNGQVAPDGQAVWGPPVAAPKTYIFTAKPDGSDIQRVTNEISGGNPAWSPNGQRIAFSDQGRIWTIGPTGLGLAAVTTDATPTTDDADPSYSPDGSKIAFSGGQTNGDRFIYTIGINGVGLAKVVGGAGDKDRSPVWSPSGQSLAFVDHDVFTVAANGSGQHQLTSLAAADSAQSADWGSTGPPDTIINEGPSGTIGARDVKFVFSTSRAPSTFECELEGQDGLADLHGWSACGSGSSASKSYTDLDAGTYTFRVRAKNSIGTDQTPASSQFSTAPPGVTVVLEGQGGGTVKSTPTGINCSPSKPDCTHVFKGTVTLFAKPNGVSVFKGWSGDCTGKSACEVKAQNNSKTVYAKFELSGEDPPACSDGSPSIKTVGRWQAKGCWDKGGKTDETVDLNGLLLYPDGQLQLSGGVLSSVGGPATLLTPTAHLNGNKIAPIVLDSGKVSLDLHDNAPIAAAFTGHRAHPAITIKAPDNGNFLGLPLKGDSITLDAPATGTVRVGGVVGLPALLGNGRANLSLDAAQGQGLRVGTIGVKGINASVANLFSLKNGSFDFTGDAWSVAGTISMPGGSGTVHGQLGFANGKLNTADLNLSDVSIGGFLDGANVTFHLASGNWTVGAGVHGVRLAGGMSFANDALSSLTLKGDGINAFGFVGIDAFSFSYGAATGWNATGTVHGAGAGAGSFVATMTYDKGVLRSAGITVKKVKIGDVFSLDDLTLAYDDDGTAQKWSGNADIGGTNGAKVSVDATLKGGHFNGGSLTAANLSFFGVVDIKNFHMALNSPGAAICGSSPTGWGVSGTVAVAGSTFSASASMGFGVDGVLKCGHLNVSKAALAQVIEVNDLTIDYNGSSTWGGGVDVVFPGGLGVKANISIKNGALASLGAGIQAPAPGLPLGPSGVFLSGGSFKLDTQSQYVITGTIDVTAGPTVPVINVNALKLHGQLQLRFPNASQPFGMEVEGTASLGNLTLAQAGIDYTAPFNVNVVGCLGDCKTGMKFGNGFATVIAKVDGKIRGTQAFQVQGDASVDLDFKGCIVWCIDQHVGIGGTVIASNIGVAACGHIEGMSNEWSAGFGYKWGRGPEAFTGCDLSGYRSINTVASPGLRPAAFGLANFRIARAADSVNVPAGLPVQSFRFVGTTAPPEVTLTGPNGESIDANHNNVGVKDGHLIAMDPSTKTTTVLVDKPSAGVWSSSLDSGSSPLASATQANGLADPDVTATVGGAGLQRTLSWTMTSIPGQSVRFVEEGADSNKVLATTSAASGTVSFAPAPGSAGTRTIVAEITQNGVPRSTADVATYDAPARSVVLVAKRGVGSGTVSGLGGKIACGKFCAADITPGQPVTLTAAAAKGSRFMGWDGACAGLQRTCTVTLEQSRTATATFDKIRKPKISSLSPRSGKRGSMVTLHGVGFLGATKVRFGKVRASEVAVISDTEIRVVVPAKAKTARIKVTGPGGTGHTKKKVRITS